MQADEIKTESTSVAPVPAGGQMPAVPFGTNDNSVWMNPAMFEHIQRVGNLLAASSMVPDHFQEKPANCVIALELANRMGLNVFALMQKMYVVHGKPGLEAQLLIAMANKSGVFADRITWSFSGTKGRDDWACTAHATDAKTGEHYELSIDWATVKKEGWLEKKGSKWKTIPELMFRYRTASWLIKSFVPEVAMGFQTNDELEDIPIDITPRGGNGEAVQVSPPPDPEAAYVPLFEAHPEAKEDEAQVREFVRATAEAFEDTEATVLDQALNQPDGFWAQFEKWKGNQTQEAPQPETSPEDDLEAEAREAEREEARKWAADPEPAQDLPAEDGDAIGNGAIRGLQKAIKDGGINQAEFCGQFEIKEVSDLPKARHNDALLWIKKRAGK